MGVFQQNKAFPDTGCNLQKAAQDVADHFRGKGFEATVEPTVGGCIISLSKGNIFKAVCGMKTALNVELQRTPTCIEAAAKVGLFGAQAVPTAIMLLVAWPVLLTQIWGLIEQSKLDDQVLHQIEIAIKQQGTAGSQLSAGIFCPHCGSALGEQAKFCSNCGKEVHADQTRQSSSV